MERLADDPSSKNDDFVEAELEATGTAVERVWAASGFRPVWGVEEAELAAVILTSSGALADIIGNAEITEEETERAAAKAVESGLEIKVGWNKRQVIHCDLLRELFGERPFREPSTRYAWLNRQGDAVGRLAAAIYADHAFDRLPILADALEDAGCTDAAILDNCRGPGPHVRGCWVVDLILGKQ
jgi:hypothetical protein